MRNFHGFSSSVIQRMGARMRLGLAERTNASHAHRVRTRAWPAMPRGDAWLRQKCGQRAAPTAWGEMVQEKRGGSRADVGALVRQVGSSTTVCGRAWAWACARGWATEAKGGALAARHSTQSSVWPASSLPGVSVWPSPCPVATSMLPVALHTNVQAGVFTNGDVTATPKDNTKHASIQRMMARVSRRVCSCSMDAIMTKEKPITRMGSG